MLQQTQVITVRPYFERWVERFPDVLALARASEDEVMKYWAGLGYYSRARNLRRGAQMILERNPKGLSFPETREEWLTIPGVGEYTAGAVLSIAQGKPEALVDGNVERVFARLFLFSREKLGEKNYKTEMWDAARALVGAAWKLKLSPSSLNQAWMELGATVCTPKNPKCGVCPLRGSCEAFSQEKVSEFPTRKKRTAQVQVSETRYAYLVDGKTAWVKTQKGEWRSGLWDFPLLEPKRGKKLFKIESTHVVTHHKILRTTWVYQVTLKEIQELKKVSGIEIRVENLRGQEGVALGSAPRRVLGFLLERLESE